ncbi:ribulose-phosphate 3-epimerase [Algoriphagus sp. AK58]|uniref:ribulose-phosphate 3-epimerase n=1 Tax=Algoriphagus sp. AK58 TaxID=1406877 RepID=UPI00165065C4|nr:ribulose-phosphate 3-epimerase [Algoriphagus sp. AK58]MBC6367886.1 ribulose-phosphate 3-epimerase [Algoriphagus sp. AK58]
MSTQIAPSILAADFANLQSEVEMINRSEADFIHVDIMDGRFVPNISFGIPVTEAIHRHAAKPLDVHLMIVEPDLYLDAFRAAGAEIISVHYEACTHLHRTIQAIRKLGAKAGVAINPHTSVGLLNEVIEEIDLVCIMSVNPGFGGQKFIENTYSKVSRLKELILAKRSKALIEIDGGVNIQNAPLLVEAGADVLVAGSFVFNSPDPLATIRSLKNL